MKCVLDSCLGSVRSVKKTKLLRPSSSIFVIGTGIYINLLCFSPGDEYKVVIIDVLTFVRLYRESCLRLGSYASHLLARLRTYCL